MNHKISDSKQIVAYFDFDGTITRRDTFLPFLIFVVGWFGFLRKSPQALIIAILYGLRVIKNNEAKQRTLTLYVKGYSFDQLDSKARDFAITKLNSYIKPEIFSKLEYHKEHKHSIIIISANLELYLKYWVKLHNLDGLIATEIEFINNICTGKLKTKNCYGQEKVIRLLDYLQHNNQKYIYSYAYGNSRGDYELLTYVNEAYWVDGTSMISWQEYRGN